MQYLQPVYVFPPKCHAVQRHCQKQNMLMLALELIGVLQGIDQVLIEDQTYFMSFELGKLLMRSTSC